MPDIKNILITGCSAGGIGDALATSLVKRGHHVLATARNTAKIPERLASSPNVTILTIDTTDPVSITAAAEEVRASGRPLDVLVNNAGAGYAMPILDIDISSAQKLYDVNVWGPLRMVQAFSDMLIASKGRLVMVSTCAAPMNVPWISTYISSKAALTSYAETLRHELAPFGVRVTTLMVGTVGSKFHDNDPLQLPPGSRYAQIEAIINGHVTGELGPKVMRTDDFAEHIVDDVVGERASGKVWKGPNAGAMGTIFHHGPVALCDLVTTYGQGLKELKEAQNPKP